MESAETGVQTTFAEVPVAAYAKNKSNRLIAVIKSGQDVVEIYEGASGELISAIMGVLNHAQ